MEPTNLPPAQPPPYPPGVYNVPPGQDVPYPYPWASPAPVLPPYPYGPAAYSLSPGPSRPRVWTVFVAYIAAFLGGMIAPAIVIVVMVVAMHPGAFAAGDPDMAALQSALTDPVIFLPAIASTQGVLLGVSVCAGVLSPAPFKKRLRLGRAQLPWYGYVIAVIGTLALGYGSGNIIELLGLGDQGVLEQFEKALGSLRGPILVVAAAVVGLAPGFGEEMLFRGYMQTRLTRRWGRLVSIAIVSFLFALIHVDLIQGSFVLLLGFYLGEVTERAGSIWPAIVSHAVNNSLSTLLAPLSANGVGVPASTAQGLITVGACAVVLALCVWYVMSRPLVPPEGMPVSGQTTLGGLPYGAYGSSSGPAFATPQEAGMAPAPLPYEPPQVPPARPPFLG
jgi:membrane protease YdiL (CAAX protease family)